jgi:hypothetical protein
MLAISQILSIVIRSGSLLSLMVRFRKGAKGGKRGRIVQRGYGKGLDRDYPINDNWNIQRRSLLL